ncbi:MAG: amidophosphoribosyltransferase [Candidatus Methylarchaceae archaeon HK02M2]|nr:amidophosphoribosyltransferase [Candidatus Methylarchaceae archaeon HK02M2]
MAGIFGFYAFGDERVNWDSSKFIYYGLSALQGRGQESTSLVIYTHHDNTEPLRWISGEGLVDEVFGKIKQDYMKGFLGIGQVSAEKRDYAIKVEKPIELALVGDGKPALHDNRQKSFQIFAEMLSKKISELRDPLEATKTLIREVGGGYSFITLTKDEKMICGRDIQGIKPLEVGAIGFDIGAVASESSALDVIGAEQSGFVKPGETVMFDPLSIEKRHIKNKTAYCSFEYVYLARLDSYLNSISVSNVRDMIGQRLSEENPVKAEVVIGVPNTAIPFSMSYSKNSGIPVKYGFTRTGRHVRSAIKPSQFDRIVGVQLKLNPIRTSVDGKEIILIDDSVVRGNTLRSTVYNLKRKGAKKVHVRIGSPPLISRCPFGTEVPPEDELIGKALSNDEIAEIIGADSFAYLSIDGLCESIGLPESSLCLGCFTGKYPERPT